MQLSQACKMAATIIEELQVAPTLRELVSLYITHYKMKSSVAVQLWRTSNLICLYPKWASTLTFATIARLQKIQHNWFFFFMSTVLAAWFVSLIFFFFFFTIIQMINKKQPYNTITNNTNHILCKIRSCILWLVLNCNLISKYRFVF